MSNRWTSYIAVGLLVSSHAAADPSADAERSARAARLASERMELTRKLVDAAATANADALAELSGDRIELRGLWFPSESCRNSYSGRVTVHKQGLAAFAACLAELKLTQKANGDRGLIHEPGVTWWPRWERGKLTALTSMEIDPTAPSIDLDVFEKHAKTKLVVKRDAKTRALMKKDPDLLVFADVRVCVDVRGKVDALEVKSEAAFESYRAAVEAAAKKWTFKPFKRDGKPIRVCTMRWFEELDGGVLGGVMGGAIDDDDVPPPPPPPVKAAAKAR